MQNQGELSRVSNRRLLASTHVNLTLTRGRTAILFFASEVAAVVSLAPLSPSLLVWFRGGSVGADRARISQGIVRESAYRSPPI
jgi:hypothetical protein